MLAKIIPVLIVLAYGIGWIGAAVIFGYAGFIAVALATVLLTAITIVVGTAG